MAIVVPLRPVEPFLNETETCQAGASMRVADGQNPSGDCSFRSLAIAGRDHASGHRGGRTCSVIGNRDQDRIDQASFGCIGQPPLQEKADDVAEAGVAHQVGHRLAANAQLLAVRIGDARAPRLEANVFGRRNGHRRLQS